MNKYTTQFFCFCPTNGVRILYTWVIEANQVHMVEDLIDAVTLHGKGFHEAIADDLHREFGGLQLLKANHHGVEIETVRGAA